MPHDDLPEHIKEHYNEARDIFNRSPRGAMALLRLCVQELCKELEGSGDINKDIEKFMQQTPSLPIQVKQSLDIIRVSGNHAVHPGEINFDDRKDDAQALFGLINLIVDIMIAQPKRVDDIHSTLPERDLKSIEKRDKKALRK